MVKRYDMEYGVNNKFHSKEPQVVPVQSALGAWVTFEDYAELQEEVEALKYWRKLALQFDGHRMNAMSMLKMVATGNFDLEEVRKFIATAPVSGDEHLRQVRADAVDEFMHKAMHEIANSYTSSTPVTPWESGMNSMLAMFAKYTQKYLKILRNNESTSILAGEE